MKRTTYTELFEDEVWEILRILPFRSTIIMDARHEFYPAAGVDEDGIRSSGKGLYTESLDGKRTGGHVTMQYLIDHLAHKTFTVIEEEA